MAAVGVVLWGILFFGLIDLSVVVQQDERFYTHYLLETGWGLLFTLLVAVPLVALAIHPRAWLLLAQLVCAALAVSVAALITPAPHQLLPAMGLVLTAAAIGLLAKQPPWPSRFPPLRGINGPMAVLVVAAAAGGVLYASQMVRAARAGSPDDDTWGLAHLSMQAAFGLAVVASAALATWGGAARARGWRALATATAVSATPVALSADEVADLDALAAQTGVQGDRYNEAGMATVGL